MYVRAQTTYIQLRYINFVVFLINKTNYILIELKIMNETTCLNDVTKLNDKVNRKSNFR